MTNLSLQEKQSLIDNFKRMAKPSGAYMKPYMTDAARHFKIYLAMQDSVEDSEEDQDRSNILLPYAYGIVERLKAKQITAVLGSKPPCAVKPANEKDQESVDNFIAYTKRVYDEARYKLNYALSTTQKIVTGWTWEKDEWLVKFLKGKRWVYTDNGYVEEEYYYPIKYGFAVNFPSVFDIFCEPGRRTVEDMSYLIEQEKSVDLEMLRQEVYFNPDTKQLEPVYDLSEIDSDLRGAKDGEMQPELAQGIFGVDFGDEMDEVINGALPQDTNYNQQVRNKIHLSHVWQLDGYFCVANGKYVINKKPGYHRPRIPYRIKNYVQSNFSPFGIGAIRPIEHAVHELDDTHSLSMDTFIQFANKMLFVKESAIVSMGDFKRRGGGLVRVKDTATAADVVAQVEHQDGTNAMLQVESNTRGIIEWATASTDFSPGASGTKQYHETLGGLLQIEQSIASVASLQILEELAGFQDQMIVIYEFINQFHFGEIEMMVEENGKDIEKILKREDFEMSKPPRIIIEEDPTFGDMTIAKNQAMVLMTQAFQYNQQVIAYRQAGVLTDTAMVKIDEMFKDLFKKFGKLDLDKFFEVPGGIIKPEEIFQRLISGEAFPPNPNSNLLDVYAYLTTQRNSPEFLEAVSSGKVPPEGLLALDSHIQATKNAIAMTLQNPTALLEAKGQVPA